MPANCSTAKGHGSRTRCGVSRRSPRTNPPRPSISQIRDLGEAELDEGLSDDLRAELAAIERAEARLEAGTYGLSIQSGEPIPDERLELLPTAERTAAEQALFER